MTARPIAIYHEHPDWFRPLFAELERRRMPFVRLDPRTHVFDTSEKECAYSLVFNRMSVSAYLRGGGHAIFSTLDWLTHLERLGVPVVNGHRAWFHEISKSRQLTLLESLGLAYPRSRIINHPSQTMKAADGLRFPIVVKANVGGSGAGITRFDTPDELAIATLDLGVDHTALVQEFVPARGGHITRVETLGGKYLYAIKVFSPANTFNLCPADACQRSDGATLVRSACPADAPNRGIRVEGFTPPAEVVADCEAIASKFGLDVGGIEYMIDVRDGRLLYYDINALSNFVADAVNVVGFDPFVKLVDYLESRQ